MIQKQVKQKFKCRSGQGMSEYMILVLLIAVGSIAGVTHFGKTMNSKLHDIQDKIQNTNFGDTAFKSTGS
ncbi:MAG: hypothetical protein H7333_11035 [Bdellovibrionales bacterium]|nr:hypothetical protein [Oligoflexia bacterium]